MVSSSKIKLVQDIQKDVTLYPIIALVDLENLPAQQLQNMRRTLKSKGVKMIMARKKLLQLALGGSGKDNIQSLSDKARGMPALLLSKDNPFSLYATVQKNKSEAPAKAGQTSPKDIVVKAGPTSFVPGPIISELAAVGIKTKVEGGKLSIMTDTTIVKEGQAISMKVAETLKRLDIKPMEIGLNIVVVWEGGSLFSTKDLHIDPIEYMSKFTQAAQEAINLAVESAYVTYETREMLIQKAFREAKAVAVEQAIMAPETREQILANAETQAKIVQKEANL